MTRIRGALISLVLGACGFAVAWGAWHVYQDHQLFHAIVKAAVAQAQQRKPSP